MKAQELRIGNLVNYQTAEGDILVARIDWQDLKWISKDEKGFNIAHSAIPLNKEWLFKLGARRAFAATWLDITKDEDPMFVSYDFNTQQVYFYKNQRVDDYFKQHIKYVHQLQNLYFALTGQELKLKTE